MSENHRGGIFLTHTVHRVKTVVQSYLCCRLVFDIMRRFYHNILPSRLTSFPLILIGLGSRPMLRYVIIQESLANAKVSTRQQ